MLINWIFKNSRFYRKANNRLAMINLKEALENKVDGRISSMLRLRTSFSHSQNQRRRVAARRRTEKYSAKDARGYGGNFDPQDPEFISLKEELERLLIRKI